MAVWVVEKHLHCTVWSLLGRQVFDTQSPEVFDPSAKLVGLQGKMVSTVVRVDRFATITDKVEFLAASEPKPRTWEGKGRSGHGLESQNVPVKRATALHALDVDGYVVQLQYRHGNRIRASSRTAKEPSSEKSVESLAEGRTNFRNGIRALAA